MNITYILNDKGEPIAEPDLDKWGEWMQTTERHVAETTVEGKWISTVFLGTDCNYRHDGPPIVWETMVFRKDGGWEEEDCNRCSGSREQAEAMHRDMVEKVKASWP